VSFFFLSIYITQNLKRDVNIRSSCSNLSMVSYTTKSLKEVLSPCIYFSYYKSRLRYRTILCRRDSESKKVFGVQKRDIRMVSGANNFQSCRYIFRYNRILTVTSLCKILEVLFYIIINLFLHRSIIVAINKGYRSCH
jgi:hypothetical protein